ncbi:hypothetical protein [Pseudomonas sp. UBA6562]|uniref:hypothetical protein n=1 Tax=Pseudomonas sp. UBA6562 TaxID=1947332 RepID=UPI0025F79BAA|nr:hypothetical protein [Pseudomonas sp. UBA6562]
MNLSQDAAMQPSFERLALKLGLELPDRLAALIALAQSGNDLRFSPYDLLWLSPQEAEREIDEWLNPTDQPGRTFLPFATNGSGEPYCFVRLENGAMGIAQALHYGQATSLAYTDASPWITSHYVRLAADLSPLPMQAQDGTALVKEVHSLHSALLPADHALLTELFSRPCVTMAFQDGPKSRPRTVNAFISREEERSLLDRLELPDPIEFAVLRDWMR